MRLAQKLLLISFLIVLMAGIVPVSEALFSPDVRLEELNVQILNVTTYIQPGDDFRAIVVLKNDGHFNAEDIFLRFYLSWDELYSSNDRDLGTMHVQLPAGVTNAFDFILEMPGDAPMGSLYLIAVADFDDDTNMANNVKAKAIQVYTAGLYNRPDLVVTDLHGTQYTAKGRYILLSVTVKNTGNTALQFYRGPGNRIDSRLENLVGFYFKYPSSSMYYTVYSQTFREYHIPDIQPGETRSFLYNIYIRSNYPVGSGYVFVKTDPNNHLTERADNNNLVYYPITILGDNQTAPIDLTIRSLAMPSTANLGSGFNITGTLANNGLAPSGPFRLSAFLSLDNVLDWGDKSVAWIYYDSIPASGTKPVSSQCTVPSGVAPGTYYLVGKVDYNGNVVETDEQNNMYVIGPITITAKPDLYMDYLSGPATARSGQSISLESTARNGGSTASGSFTIKYYLSTDPTITSSDRLLGQRQVGSLNASLMDTRTTSVNLPSGLSPGTYFIGAIVDTGNTVDEGREDNNVCTDILAITITVPAGGMGYK